MRDTIKSIEYYEEYLTLNAKRLERFQHQLETLQPDNISGKQNCAAFIANLYWSRICALYSSGAHIADIKKIYPQYVKYLVQCVIPQEGYFDVIDAVSLGVLFEAKECLPDLKLVLQQTNMRNKLSDTLLCSLDGTWDISELDLHCTWFSEFQKCTITDREKFLKAYVTKNGIKPIKMPHGTTATNLLQTFMLVIGALKLPPLQKYMVCLTAKNGRTIPMI